MSNVNLGQDVANKQERKWTAVLIVAKSHPLSQAEGMHRYGSLLNFNLYITYLPTLCICRRVSCTMSFFPSVPTNFLCHGIFGLNAEFIWHFLQNFYCEKTIFGFVNVTVSVITTF